MFLYYRFNYLITRLIIILAGLAVLPLTERGEPMKDLTQKQWFVMRDLKRVNAKLPAYKFLSNNDVTVFVPTKWNVVIKKGKRERITVPVLQDLLFVYDSRQHLDPLVAKMPTLQYRWLRNTYREPMVVPQADMNHFMQAVKAFKSTQYYLPEEITPQMYGKKISIIGGPLNGYQGYLLSVRGSKVKRLLVELKGYLAAGVEVNPEYIQFV